MKNGLYNSQELVDTIISDCNTAVGAIAQGKYILWCRIMYEMVQKLALLKNGIANDLKNREETISNLKDQLHAAGVDIEDVPVEELMDDVNKTTCKE